MSAPALQKLYERSPSMIQDLLVSAYGCKLYLREYGWTFERYLEDFKKRPWMTREELRRDQEEALRRVVEHAYARVPYYRRVMQERKLKPSDIRGLTDLPKLPLLTREDVKAHGQDLIDKRRDRRRLIAGHTSGTTGSPLHLYYDRRSCFIKNLVDWRHKSWAGIAFRDRMAFFLGRVVVPVEQKRPPFWRHNLPMNQLFCSSFHLSAENMEAYVEKLMDYRPLAVEGYPSTLYIVAGFLLGSGRTLPVKAAFTSSETLLPLQREKIERAFECKLFDFYGMAERAVFAGECERQVGHHIHTDYGIVEVMKSESTPAEPGELGRLIATGLHNYGMPLLRYATSDVTALDGTPCACGRTFPLMAPVTTKDEDIVTTPDGRLISASTLTHPFKPLHSVAESQVIQEDADFLRVKIVRLPSYSQADSDHLVRELKQRLGHEMKIELEFVSSIPRTAAGKLRWVISKVPVRF